MNKTDQEFSKWLSDIDWNFFSTITFTNKLSDETIQRKMNYFSNHYLIDKILWFREFTSDGKPHIHMVIKSNKVIKGYRKLSNELRKLGNTDFQIYENRKSSKVISYISKTYNSENILWDVKL